MANKRYLSFGLSTDQRRRFDEISSVLKAELHCEGELKLPVVTKNRVANCRCNATGEAIALGEECVLLLSTLGTGRRAAVIKGKAVFLSLLETGSFRFLRLKLRCVQEEARRLRSQKEGPVLPLKNSCYCIQCGKPIPRPEGMSSMDFSKVRRCDSCMAAGEKMPYGGKRYCRTCGVPFTAEGNERGGSAASTCPEHRYRVPGVDTRDRHQSI